MTQANTRVLMRVDRELDTIEVFSGPEPPKQRIIRSRTSADNIRILGDYLATDMAR